MPPRLLKIVLPLLLLLAAVSLVRMAYRPVQNGGRPKAAAAAASSEKAPLESGRSLSRTTTSRPATSASLSLASRRIINDPETSPPLLRVTGHVRHIDGSPATNATVQIGGWKPWLLSEFTGTRNIVAVTETAADGSYRIEVPATRDLQVHASLPGYISNFELVTDSDNPWKHKKAVLERNPQLILGRSAPLSGRVADEHGVPLAGVRVAAAPAARFVTEFQSFRITTSTAEGRFSFTDLPAGEIVLGASLDGYQSAYLKDKSPNDQTIITLREGGGTAEGQVVLHETGEAVSSATVVLQPQNSDMSLSRVQPRPSAVTDSQGHFRIVSIPDGRYTLGVRKEGLGELPQPKASPSPLIFEHNKAVSGLKATLFRGFTLRGTIRDAATSRPLDGVRYATSGERPNEPPPTALTDATGLYETKPFFETEGWLAPELEGYHMLDENGGAAPGVTVRFDANQTTTVYTRDLAMARSVLLSGWVVTEGGAPAGAATLSLNSRSHPVAVKYATESDGHFAVFVRPGDQIRLKAEARGWGPAYAGPIHIGQETPPEVRLTLSRGARVEGTVVDNDGHPMAGLQMVAQRHPSTPRGASEVGGIEFDDFPEQVGSTATGPGGEFRFADLPAGYYSLTIPQVAKRELLKEEFQLAAGEERTGLRLVITDRAAVTGRVLHAQTGQPLGGIKVSAQTVDGTYKGESIPSDSEGHFRIEQLNASTSYTLQATHPDYEIADLLGIIPGKGEAEIRLKPLNDVTLTVHILDQRTNQPPPGATLKLLLDEDQAEASEQRPQPIAPGQFRVTGLKPNRTLHLEASAPGFVPLTGRINVPSNVTAFENTLNLKRGSEVRGRIVSRKDKTPRAGLGIGIGNDQYRTTGFEFKATDSDGRFTVSDVPPGLCLFIIAPQADIRSAPILHRQAVTVAEGAVTDLGTIELGEGGTVRGRVIRSGSGEPLAKETVQMDVASSQEKMRSTVTSADGAFEFTNVRQPDSSEITLSLPRLKVSVSARGTVMDDEVKEVTIRVGGASLRGQILQAGKPVKAAVSLGLGSQALQQTRFIRTGEGGTFNFQDLPPGRWNLSARSENDSDVRASEYVELQDGDEAERTIQLPGGQIAGRVVDADGKPVPRAAVMVQMPDSDEAVRTGTFPKWRRTQANPDGSFALQNLPPGRYMVRSRFPGKGKAASAVTLPKDGDAPPVELRLRPSGATLLSSALEAATGNPLEKAWCRIFDAEGKYVDAAPTRSSDGISRVEELPAGRFTVWIGCNGYTQAAQEVILEEGEVKSITSELEPAGRVAWGIVGKDGSARSDLPVTLRPLDEGSREPIHTGTTGEDGTWSMPAVRTGRYEATATLPDGKQIRETLTVEQRSPTELVSTVE